MSQACPLCGAPSLRPLLDLGLQPLGNRFPACAEEDRVRVPFAFGACANCGVARFLNPPPPELQRPEVDWIRYNEPEGHLDDLVARLIGLPGITPDTRFVGITYKDASTLQRLREKGYAHTRLLDLGITDPRAGIETVQARLAECAEAACADVLVVRHVLEHARDTRATAAGLERLLLPGGRIVYEVPDSSRLFAKREVCFLWEEHALYLTPGTFRQTLGLLGCEIDWMNSYPYAVENALVAFVRPGGGTRACDAKVAAEGFAAAEHFVSSFAADRAGLHARLAVLAAQGKRIAAFGAGHLAAKFVNFHGIGKFLAFVADDHPGKQARLLAGSGLPIRPGSALKEDAIDLALMSLNPESEERVMAKFQAELPQLRFVSMFRSSPRSVWQLPLTDWRSINPAVHYTASATGGLRDADLAALEALAPDTPLRRARICTHRDPSDTLQEMMIVLDGSTYVRPHCHPGKAESLHVLKGRARLLLFDALGRVERVVELAPFGEGATWYFRIADPVFHTLLIETDSFVFHETTTGPFDPADTVFAPWAPEAGAPGVADYLTSLGSQSQP